MPLRLIGCIFQAKKKQTDMLMLRSLGIPNYLVLQARRRIGLCFAKRRRGGWFRDVTIHLTDGRMSSSNNAARAEFKAAWEALKARTPPPEQPEETRVSLHS